MKKIIYLVLAVMFLTCISAGCITYENTNNHCESLIEFIEAEGTTDYNGYDVCVAVIDGVEYSFIGFENVIVSVTPVNKTEG